MQRLMFVIALAACGAPGRAGERGAAGAAGAGGGGIEATAPTAAAWPVTLASSDAHGCVTRGGGVWCWGDNDQGQLGDGTVRSRDGAARVPGVDDAMAVAVTDGGTCVLRASGAVICWGSEERPLVSRTLLDDAIAISAWRFHTCAVSRAGGVRCWGYSRSSAHGQADEHVDAAADVAGVRDVVEVAATFRRGCARLETGAVACWGAAWVDGDPVSTTPTLVPGLTDVTAIWGGATLCLRRAGGEVLCEARGADGDELVPIADWTGATFVASAAEAACAVAGDGRVSCRATSPLVGSEWWLRLERDAAPMTLDADGVVAVAASRFLCVAHAGGEVACRGAQTRYAPQPVPGMTDVVELVGGPAGACARRKTGAVFCWGAESALGAMASSPEPVAGLDASATLVPAAHRMCALDAGGQLGCGYGYGERRTTEVPAMRVRQAAMTTHACAVRTDGKVACWGDNGAGELGDGTTTAAAPSRPVPARGIANAVEVAVGYRLSCARLRTGAVSCWGDGAIGAIGDGDLTDAVQLVMGTHFACARRRGGTVRCWGTLPPLAADQRHGQQAREVPGIDDAVDVAAAGDALCVVRAGGGVTCAGRVGGRITEEPLVIEIPDVRDATHVVMGERTACVLRRGGAVACWGDNRYGAVGDGSADRLTPIP